MGLHKTGSGKQNIYVSISKKADSSIVAKVLDYLRGIDASIYTYDGQVYSTSQFYKMDAVIIIPPTSGAYTGNTDDAARSHTVGKGQYMEVVYFYEKVECPIYIVNSINDGLHLDELVDYAELEHQPDWNNWGYVLTNDACIDCVNYVGFTPTSHYYAIQECNQPIPVGNGILDACTDTKPMFLHMALTREFI